MIQRLDDIDAFRRRRRIAWQRNVEYWLQGNLRHVADAGAHIIRRVRSICLRTGKKKPVLLDMGFGNGWLLEALVESNTEVSYIGVDVLELFVQRAKAKFAVVEDARFVLADLEEELLLDAGVDVVVNAFNFIEICNLRLAMENAGRYMNEGGTLFMSTIDKTYLILALSSDWENFHQNLKRYQDIPGVKFDFQRIDLGDGLSECLEYPSVLYSTEDYIDAARTCGLEMKQ